MNPLKQSIMFVLLLLVAMFISGMWVMSSLNLGYSQQALSDLRRTQIEDTFKANLERIDARHQLMEQNTEDLARLGETFNRLRLDRDSNQELETALRQHVRDFPEAFGGGIWFEPQAFSIAAYSVARYAYWAAENRIAVVRHHGQSTYQQQEWYRTALPPDWSQTPLQPHPYYWSAAYYSEQAQAMLITLASPMHNQDGRIIGLATTDWRTEEAIKLIGRVRVTPSSFAFLLDSANRNLSSPTQGNGGQPAEPVMHAILTLIKGRNGAGRERRPAHGVMQRETLTVDGVAYALLHARTQSGMLFGLGVPQHEIDSVLEPMRQSNYRILAITGVSLLALSGLILYFVAGIMRQLDASYTDPLTQLPNRARLLQDLKRHPRSSLILINLDAFKEINGFFGHECGDYVLTNLANQLAYVLAQDSEQGRQRLYKMSADEFAVLIDEQLDAHHLEIRLQTLSAFIQTRLLLWHDQEINLTATLGAAAFTGKQPVDVLSAAAIALKLARQQQKNHLIYDPLLKLRERYEHNLLWASHLKQALQDDRICPYFQPIMDNHSGQISKFECLVRMLDEHGHPVNPALFLDVAKRIRLHRQITRIMVEKCCAVFRDLPFEFSINLSYEDMIDPELTRFIKLKLLQSGIGPRLIFEILESEGIENYKKVHTFISEVKALGCRIAIDDFGTGYSNFEHLLRLNIDVIKIDGSLIKQLDTDANAYSVTLGIVNFARSLGMQTVAEFVHSPAVQQKVQALGIDYSQGAHIGMPQANLVIRPSFQAHADTL
ncbi:MAG: EAL domain-containing protein [Pseudomonas sp.]|uniref:EAL domain-containing protein n=1 Tax=Pseudomonas sp. TaxID=306 RepID=UPI003D0D7D1B